MSESNPNKLPLGLPTCLVSDPDGFDRFRELLEIKSRSELQSLHKSVFIKKRLKLLGFPVDQDLKTAQRLRRNLTFSYSDPLQRVAMWKYFHKKTTGFRNSVTKIFSLEYFALRTYEQTFSDLTVDEEKLLKCSSFFHRDFAQEEWMKPALALLPSVYDDFLNWQSLTPERQRQTVLAAFSIATILDDVRLLHWAAKSIPDAEAEFRFATVKEEVTIEDNIDASRSVDNERVEIENDVVIALQHACVSLSDVALELSGNPHAVDLFTRVAGYAEEIACLRDPVIETIAAEFVENLVVEYCNYLRNLSDSAPWLAAMAKEIESSWRLYHSVECEGGANSKLIQTNVEKSRRRVEKFLKKWTMADTELQNSKASLQELQTQQPSSDSDFVAQISYGEQETYHLSAVTSARGKEVKQKRMVIDAAFPPGWTFSSSEIPDSKKKQKIKISDSNGVVAPNNQDTSEVGARGQKSKRKLDVSETIVSVDVAPEDKISRLPDLNEIAIWNAVCEGRLSLAYQITQLIQKVETEVKYYFTAELFAAVAFAEFLHNSEGRTAQEFSKNAELVLTRERNFNDAELETRDALSLLLFSASLLPALFAPKTVAIQMLQSVKLSSDLAMVYQFSEIVAKHAQKLQYVGNFDVPRLKSILNETHWEQLLEQNKAKVREWSISAGNERFQFEPIRRVWKYWLSNNGILSDLTKLITSETASLPKVQEIVASLVDKKSYENLVETECRKILGFKIGKGIHPRALAQLEKHLAIPIDLANEWLNIMESKPSRGGYVEQIVSELRSDIASHIPSAQAEIVDVQKGDPSLPLTAALAQAQRSIESLTQLFEHDGNSFKGIDTCEPNRILLCDIPYVVELNIGTDGNIDSQLDPKGVLALLTDGDSHSESLADAFTKRLERGYIASAQFTLEQMVYEKNPEEDQCRATWLTVITEKQIELEQELDDLSEKLEQAFTLGEFSEKELETLNASIVSVRELCAQKESVVIASEQLSIFKSEIVEKFNASIKSVQDQLTGFFPLDNPKEQAFVDEALESRDLITLHEQLDRLKAGERLLPVERSRRETFESFLSVVAKIDEAFEETEGHTLKSCIESITDGEDPFELNFSSLTSSQRLRSVKLLELWYTMANKEIVDKTTICEFLECLGFSVQSCVLSDKNLATVITEQLRNRELCPVSAFGSDADGHYDIVLNWRSPPEEKIVQLVGENRNRCTLVLHFGKLRQGREWLGNWSINNRIPFVIIDESLVIYLSSLPSGILRAMYDCSLPFTCVDPFFTAAGSVPPESFYGRENERKMVMDRRGSCFVYGGRQLGKTALLRSVEATFNDPQEHRVAIYVDLKVEDVGIAYESEHIWNVLWTYLQNLNVIKAYESVPNGREKLVDSFTKLVRIWLSNSEENRILLLLDEADAFLTGDLKNDFRESTRLKGLMDETDRKFKVVFSGLHNVLRTTESANHPLAHFGEPICVGPLLSNGELERAKALLREPLAAVGCKFEKDSLLTYILVWTNYYPSLIQLCGAELVKYWRENVERHLPNIVTKHDINFVFSREGFREFIRQRFSLTLQLDPRYEVITYAIALRLQGDKEGLARGLLPIEIFEEAKEWWQVGFEISQPEFNSLLDEMCGLGVLRMLRIESKKRSYTFRNPNVLLLLGDSSEIEQILYKDRTLPEVFEASAYHAQYPNENRHQSPRRGPLSFEQESKLRRSGGVTVISGTSAANLESVGEFLGQRMTEKTFRHLNLCTDEAGLEKQLTGQRPSRESVHVYVVPTDAPWTMRWVERAAAAQKRVKRGKFMQIVFLADPDQLWRFVLDLPDDYLEDSNGLFEWMRIHPWKPSFLHRWCSDQNLQVAKPQVDELLDVSGGWPCILEQHAESTEKNWQAKEDATRIYIEGNRTDLLTKLGLASVPAKEGIGVLQDYEAFTSEEALGVANLVGESDAPNLDGNKLVRRLWWAKQLGLILEIRGTWKVNSLVKQILVKPVL